MNSVCVGPSGRWKARPGGSTGGSTEDSIGGLDRGGSTGGSMDGSTGELVRGARPGGSTEGSTEDSIGGLDRGVLPGGREARPGNSSGGSTGGFYRGGSIHVNVYYNEATGDRYLLAQFAWTSTWKPRTAFVWDRSDKFLA